MSRSTKSRRTDKPTRKPLTRELLLPISVTKFRSLSLQNHLALVALQNGCGDMEHVVCLFKVVYLTWFINNKTLMANADEIHAVLRLAEVSLHACALRLKEEMQEPISHDEGAVLKEILFIHDQQLSVVSLNHLQHAWERLQQWLSQDGELRIPEYV